MVPAFFQITTMGSEVLSLDEQGFCKIHLVLYPILVEEPCGGQDGI